MSEAESELLEALARVAATLESLDVEYLVGGSVASSLFGEPRLTVDADVLARLVVRHAEPLVAQLANEFYAAPRSKGSGQRA